MPREPKPIGAQKAQTAPEARTPTPAPEPTYDAREIAQNSPRLFGFGVDIATAALDYNHVDKCSLSKAKLLIKEYAERKV